MVKEIIAMNSEQMGNLVNYHERTEMLIYEYDSKKYSKKENISQ